MKADDNPRIRIPGASQEREKKNLYYFLQCLLTQYIGVMCLCLHRQHIKRCDTEKNIPKITEKENHKIAGN